MHASETESSAALKDPFLRWGGCHAIADRDGRVGVVFSTFFDPPPALPQTKQKSRFQGVFGGGGVRTKKLLGDAFIGHLIFIRG